MANQNTSFVEIENYIRDLITKNNGIFNRDSIMMQSTEWMLQFPVEFNSILNFIQNDEKNDEMMDDSTPSVAFGSRFADDSTPSVAFGSRFDDDSTPSVAFGSRFDDDSTPSVAFGSRFADDSTPSVAHYEEYSCNIMPDHISSGSPMGSEHIDSSPGGYPDDDFESDTPLQRTMSYAPPRK